MRGVPRTAGPASHTPLSGKQASGTDRGAWGAPVGRLVAGAVPLPGALQAAPHLHGHLTGRHALQKAPQIPVDPELEGAGG